jgi:long-subunit fatty acid transport protein
MSVVSWARAATCVLVLSVAGRALGGPLLAPDPVGLGFYGPTDAEATAIWYNPAALGELSGSHLLLSFAPPLLSQSAQREGGGGSSSLDLQYGGMIAATTDFASEHVRVGVGYLIPFRDRGQMGPGSNTLDPQDDGPLRYQRLITSFRNQYLTPAAAFRINPDVSFGIGLNLVWSYAHLGFDRDRPLDFGTPGVMAAGGLEQPSAAERIDAQGTSFSGGFQAGFLWRVLGRVTIGGGFMSRAVGLSRSGILADEYGNCSSVTCSANASVTKAGGQTTLGYGQIAYNLPDVVHIGARWLVTDRLEAAASLRYVDWGLRSSSFRIRLTSEALRAMLEPEQIVLYRGFHDSYAGTVRAGYCAKQPSRPGERCRLRFGVQARFDTGMYDAQATSADALDGPTLDLGVLFEWRLARHFRLMGGGSYGQMVTRNVTNSVYSPQYALACVDSGRDSAACANADAGRGLPSANGRYSLETYTGSLALAIDWWGR